MDRAEPLTWGEDCRIGIDMVDSEHKSLIASFNRFIVQVGRTEETGSIKYGFDILVSYVSHHFRHEEELMADLGYPGADAHVRSHTEFLERLKRQKAALFKKTLSGKHFCEAFRAWMVDHIQDEDRKIADFVERRGDRRDEMSITRVVRGRSRSAGPSVAGGLGRLDRL